MEEAGTESPTLLILGCGYVGFAVARRAHAQGMRVVALTRNDEKAEALRASPSVSECVVAQLHESSWHQQVPAMPEFVLNCVSAGGGGLEGYRQSYLEGQRSVVEWARGARPGHMIYTGSTGVYGKSDGSVVRESDVSDHELSETGQVLLAAERVLNENASAFRSATVLRLAGIYGPGRHYLLDGIRRGEHRFPAESDYPLNLVYLEDIAEAILAVFQWRTRGKGQAFEVFNVSDNNAASKRSVIEWLSLELGTPKPIFDPNMEAPRARARRLGGRSIPNRIISSNRIQEVVGWRPRFPDYRAGFRDILRRA